jgi:hypothetical protein
MPHQYHIGLRERIGEKAPAGKRHAVGQSIFRDAILKDRSNFRQIETGSL